MHRHRGSRPSFPEGCGWRSTRIYDIGACSLFLRWLFLAPEVVGLVQDALSGLDQGIQGSRPRGTASSLAATLMGSGVVDEDRLRIVAGAVADGFGGSGFECGGGNYEVRLQLSLRTAPGRAAPIGVDPQRDAAEGQNPYELEVRAPSGLDFVPIIHEAEVDLLQEAPECGNENLITGALEGGIRGLLPYIVTVALREILLVDPRLIGVPDADVRSCSADTDCNFFAPGGPAYPGGHRHRCRSGECWYQIEPERVHARPQGLEIVLAEDGTDEQFVQLGALSTNDLAGPPFAGSCGPVRDPQIAPDGELSPSNLDGLTRTGL